MLSWGDHAQPLALGYRSGPVARHEILTDMDRTAGGALRWTRALLLAVVAMGSGVIAHLSAAGRLPGPWVLGLLFLLCVAGAAALLGRPASTLRVVVMTVAGQTFVRGFLTALSGHRGDPPLRRVVAAPVPRPGPGAHGAAAARLVLRPRLRARPPGHAAHRWCCRRPCST